ncbi:MAG: response regulator transcription factor [Gemmataceae bacterium]
MASPTILVVDDAADTLHLIGTFLRHHGYEVLLAPDGDAGLSMANEHRPDLVVTDMLMPGVSGFRVIDQLKSDPKFQPRVVMISAQDAPLHRAYAAALGVDDFLPKPFGLQQLLDSVQRFFPVTMPPGNVAVAKDTLIQS